MRKHLGKHTASLTESHFNAFAPQSLHQAWTWNSAQRKFPPLDWKTALKKQPGVGFVFSCSYDHNTTLNSACFLFFYPPSCLSTLSQRSSWRQVSPRSGRLWTQRRPLVRKRKAVPPRNQEDLTHLRAPVRVDVRGRKRTNPVHLKGPKLSAA